MVLQSSATRESCSVTANTGLRYAVDALLSHIAAAVQLLRRYQWIRGVTECMQRHINVHIAQH